MLVDFLEHATPAILRRLPSSEPAADLLAELIHCLRAGGGEPPQPRGATATYVGTLRLLEASVAAAIEESAPSTPARDVWSVATWFGTAVERALRDENRRLVTMLDALPDHVILQDRDARILFANRSAADLASATVGRPREELVGVSVRDGQQPDSFKQFALEIIARACQGEAFTEEFVLPGPDGPQWRETHLAPVYGADGKVEAVAIASRDIHARKQAEARLLLLSKIGALVATTSSTVLSGVAAATIPELADLAVLELVDAGGDRFSVAHRDLDRAREIEAPLRSGARVADVMRELGATTTLEVPIVVLGVPIAVATFAFTPESGRRHEAADHAIADEVVRRVAQIVENARLHEERAQALVFRERVMGILGHDLRNPLAAVLSLSATLLQRPDVPARAKEGLGHIRRSAERMEQMICTILDFTQLRFLGAPSLSLESFDFESLVRTIVEELQVAHPNRIIAVAARGDLRGRWDYTRMGQVISNLVGNALTHGARESEIAVEVSSADGTVEMAVSNRGPTIPTNALAKLFEPFWQASTESKRGLGLGLFIAQQIVNAHGGTLEVRSQDELTMFTVRLPRSSFPPAG
ncbi:MAG TPA: PAS domain-containing sensor histidine kinase [Kofleriaceae bacterium]|nr:PAS domain-containing sensor histidine kinase [Kofleriaceae bacterium]